MSWDWATTVVGIAGIVGTLWGARSQANVTLQLAREERAQTRLERSYLEVQRLVERSAQWAASAMPTFGEGQDLFPPHPEDDAQVLEASALRLYWSPEVRELVQEWTRARNALILHVRMARTSERYRGEAWGPKVTELKQALSDTEDALRARMSHELLAVGPVRRRHWRPQVLRWRHRAPRVSADTSPPVLDGQRAEAG